MTINHSGPEYAHKIDAILGDLEDKITDLVYEAGLQLKELGLDPSSAAINASAAIGRYTAVYYNKHPKGSILKDFHLACLRGALCGRNSPVDEEGNDFSAPSLKHYSLKRNPKE